ncbi:TetR/AcrR family transcriptional regulator [Halorubrum ezzemoulense]|nr:TetR/AcrR family transcriptional regulator [Halorubrum ezzemoulense]
MNDSQDGPANESVESLSDDANDAGSGDRGSDRNPPQERSAIGSDNSDRSGRETGPSKDTKEAIMEATFRALSKHGYKDLRMRDIGEEMDLTRQVIHYHFDGKYDLMSSFSTPNG